MAVGFFNTGKRCTEDPPCPELFPHEQNITNNVNENINNLTFFEVNVCLNVFSTILIVVKIPLLLLIIFVQNQCFLPILLVLLLRQTPPAPLPS